MSFHPKVSNQQIIIDPKKEKNGKKNINSMSKKENIQ